MTQLASPPEVAATVTDDGRRRGTRPGAGPAGRVGRRGGRGWDGEGGEESIALGFVLSDGDQ